MTLIYKIKCPSCHSKADALMKTVGINGTYREATSKMGADKIICSNCNLIKNVKDEDSSNYDFWYTTTFKENYLWAYNEEHLDIMIEYLSGKMARKDTDSYLETLPQWMITNKIKVVERLKKLKKL